MNFRSISLLAGAMLLASGALAENAGPAGLWKTVDDATGKPRALVRISVSNGEFSGKIEKIFRESHEDQAPLCTSCKGSRKDQPIIGMTILEGLTADGDGYGGGKLLDPEVGKIYEGKITMLDGGNKLNLRGYIGISLFGRSQVWLRQQ
jgi:uncharacterized protein (DUF2147 family)